MGRRATNPHIDDAAFRALDERYRRNEDGDAMVEALNRLPADDRSMVIMWVLLDRNKTALAKSMGLSVPFVRDRLWRLQELMKEYYKQITKEREENDESIF